MSLPIYESSDRSTSQADSSTSCNHTNTAGSTWSFETVILNALIPERTNSTSNLLIDTFLPTTLNHAVHVNGYAAKFFAAIPSLAFDIVTLPFRAITVLPKMISDETETLRLANENCLSEEVFPGNDITNDNFSSAASPPSGEHVLNIVEPNQSQENRVIAYHVNDDNSGEIALLERIFINTIVTERTDTLNHVIIDTFLPTTLNQAIRINNLVVKIFAIPASIALDLCTLPLRAITILFKLIIDHADFPENDCWESFEQHQDELQLHSEPPIPEPSIRSVPKKVKVISHLEMYFNEIKDKSENYLNEADLILYNEMIQKKGKTTSGRKYEKPLKELVRTCVRDNIEPDELIQVFEDEEFMLGLRSQNLSYNEVNKRIRDQLMKIRESVNGDQSVITLESANGNQSITVSEFVNGNQAEIITESANTNHPVKVKQPAKVKQPTEEHEFLKCLYEIEKDLHFIENVANNPEVPL